MKYTNYILLLILIISLSSCNDFFESTVEIDPPEHTEQLVVQAFGSTNDNVLNVLVSKSSGLFDNVDNEDLLINDASVVLVDGSDRYTLSYIPVNQNQGRRYNYILDDENVEFIPGKTYTIEVVAEDFPDATSSCTIPNNVLPENFNFDPDGPSIFDEEYSKVSMTISDPDIAGDHYEFSLSIGNEFNGDLYFDNVYTESLDPLIEFSLSSLLLNDDSFNGEEKFIDLLLESFYTENEPDIEDNIYVFWRTISSDHYKYLKSFDDHLENSGNPFASPVQVFSNIENGIGIFSIYNEDYIKIN